ncbi:winged helix-turn-helix domain-containing protein [Streptomyces sp. NPDC049577]
MFHISYTVEGTWQLLKRHGWSWRQPARRAIERDDCCGTATLGRCRWPA